MFFPPFMMIFFLFFLVLLFFVFGLVQVGAISFAFAKLGIPPENLFSILMLCIFGSFVNIPIKKYELKEEQPMVYDRVRYFGIQYQPPRRQQKEMVLAVNLGGAIIPSMLALYLLFHIQHPIRALLALAIVTFVVHKMAKPIKGVGIATPIFIPPLVAALAALYLNFHESAATAYIAGTLGTLIGADLLNIDKIKEIGAPVASIGGAGTFDGVFLTGIIAVLLA